MNNKSKLIVISGKARHGKDTFCDILIDNINKIYPNRKIYKTAFSNPIKKAIMCMFPQIDSKYLYGFSELRDYELRDYINPITKQTLTVRDVLLQLGAWGRSCNPIFWVMATCNEIKQYLDNDYIVIISDCRYQSEKISMKNIGGTIIRIVRQNVDYKIDDQSENDLDNDNSFDKIITNTTIEDLNKQAIDVIYEYIL